MQDIFSQILQSLSANADVITLSIATGLAAAILFILKYISSFIKKIVKATPTKLDDEIVKKTKKILKDKMKDL